MADVNCGHGGGRNSIRPRIRGQFIITGGVIFAVVLNGLTLVLNSVIVTEIRAARDDTTPIDYAVGFPRNAGERADNPIRQINPANRGKGFLIHLNRDLPMVIITATNMIADTTTTHEEERSTGAWQFEDSGGGEQECSKSVEVTHAAEQSGTVCQTHIADDGSAGCPP